MSIKSYLNGKIKDVELVHDFFVFQDFLIFLQYCVLSMCKKFLSYSHGRQTGKPLYMGPVLPTSRGSNETSKLVYNLSIGPPS